MSKKRIFIATSSFGLHSPEIEKLLYDNFIITKNETGRKLNNKELGKKLVDVDGVIAGTESYNKKILKDNQSLKIISRLGVGIDNLDVEFLNKKGIKIKITNTNPSQAVAELVLGFIIMMQRNIPFHNNDMKSGIWEKKMGSLLHGKTLGIVGLGKIGKELVRLTGPFHLNYIAFDKYKDEEFSKKYNIEYLDLNGLFTKADIITIHLNLTSETTGLINKLLLSKMKSSAVIINTSRGEIVNEGDLYSVLKEKLIKGACLDVFTNEPYFGELSKQTNVVSTPHIGSYAKEIRNQMELESVNNLIEYFYD